MTQLSDSLDLKKQISYEFVTDIYTKKSLVDVNQVLLRQVQTIADYVRTYPDGTIGICKIAASHGAINRDDAAFFRFIPIDSGYKLMASVIYKPSIFFWIFLVVTLPTVVLFLLHLYFYFAQKQTVLNAVQKLLQEFKREVEKGF